MFLNFRSVFLSIVINGTSRDLAKLTLLTTKRRRALRINLARIYLRVLRGFESLSLKIPAHRNALF